MHDDLFFATNKIYVIPEYSEYRRVILEHIQNQNQNYPTMSPENKWHHVMTAFKNSLQHADMPEDCSIQKYREVLETLKTHRLATAVSPHKVPLETCLAYFEEFYFLYSNNRPIYSLDQKKKQKLLVSIMDASVACETGLNSQLDAVSQQHKKDVDWIADELTKQRSNTIKVLLSEFMPDNLDSHNVHAHNAIVDIANSKKLGIPKTFGIKDIYAGMVSHELPGFFEKKYRRAFDEYEKNIINGLTSHLLNEFIQAADISSAEWETLPANAARVSAIQNFISDYFNNSTSVYEFIKDDSTASKDIYTLKDKSQVVGALRKLIVRKLREEHYYVSLENIEKREQIILDEKVSLAELISLNDELNSADKGRVNDSIRKNTRILIKYPELLIGYIKSNYSILSSTPIWLSNDPRFIKSLILVFGDLLLQAREENDYMKIEQLKTCVLSLIKSEYGYLAHLSGPVRAILNINPVESNPAAVEEYLKSATNLTMHNMLQQAKSLNPTNLLQIMNDHSMPGFNQYRLEKFIQELGWTADKDYLTIKNQAYTKENFEYILDPSREKNASTFISKTDNWIMAFYQYQAYQSSNQKLMNELLHVIVCLLKILRNLSVICLTIILLSKYWLPYLLLSSIFAAVSTIYILINNNFTLLINNHFTQFEQFSGIGQVLAGMVTVIIISLSVAIVLAHYLIHDFATELFDICKAELTGAVNEITCTLRDIIEKSLFYISNNLNNYSSQDSLEDTCESIVLRLELMDDQTATDKASILRGLLDQAKGAVGKLHNKKLIDCLKDGNQSFAKVAGEHRENSFWSLVGSKTTSQSMLDAAANIYVKA